MLLQLFDKMLADKCMILLSFAEQSWNNVITAITVTLNIPNPFNVSAHKTNISSMCMILGKVGEGDGLLMRAPLITLFWDFRIEESGKCVSTCSKYEGYHFVELPLDVGITFLGAYFIFTDFVKGFKIVVYG